MKQILATLVLCALAVSSPSGNTASHTRVPGATANVPAGDYSLDRAHASLIFRVSHLGFSHYTARFKRFDARLKFDPADLAASQLTATVDARSIETDYPDPAKLDFNAQLQNDKWLDTAKFPEMRYRSTRVEVTGPNTLRVTGDLTLSGVTHPVALDVAYNGGYAGHPFDPHARVGFSARGTLKRSAFGMRYGIPAPGSNLGVGDDVEIIVEAEFSGPAWTPPRSQD